MSIKTKESTEIEETEAWLDSLDPETAEVRRPSPEIIAIRNAAIAVEEANAHLRSAVLAARKRHVSWGRIGSAIGISRQAAQQRFGG